MTQPRRDIPADNPQVDRVREAMRYHDERLEPNDEDVEPTGERDDAREPDEPRGPEQAEDSGEA